MIVGSFEFMLLNDGWVKGNRVTIQLGEFSTCQLDNARKIQLLPSRQRDARQEARSIQSCARLRMLHAHL